MMNTPSSNLEMLWYLPTTYLLWHADLATARKNDPPVPSKAFTLKPAVKTGTGEPEQKMATPPPRSRISSWSSFSFLFEGKQKPLLRHPRESGNDGWKEP